MNCRQAGNTARLFSFIAILFFLGCSEKKPAQVKPAFYHWQTTLQLTENERLYLDSLGVIKLYVKFFDVDWDESSRQPVPLAQVEIDTANLSGLEIVPTIFITNRTLLNLPAQDVDTLAGKIFQKIQSLLLPAFSPSSHSAIKEIQFDCDWTTQTREKLFTLIDHFRKKTLASASSLIPHSSSLSATIRLHQMKFFKKTGIPPVDKGMLMLYNTGDVEDWETENSILDLHATEDYLSIPHSAFRIPHSPYPLELDVALPLFRWGVLFRDGRMIKLVNDLGEEDLRDTLRFSKIGEHRFAVRKSTYLQGYYLYEGDQIRLEGVDERQLSEAADLLAKRFSKSSPLTVAFYHLDTTTLKRFPHETLEKILEKF